MVGVDDEGMRVPTDALKVRVIQGQVVVGVLDGRGIA